MNKYGFFYDEEVRQLAIVTEDENGESNARYGSLEDIYKLMTQSEGTTEETEFVDKGLVYHPSHYNKEGRRECWDEMSEVCGQEATIIFDAMSAFKYQYRAGEKEHNSKAQDEEKIKNYLTHAQMLRESILECGSKDVLAFIFASSILDTVQEYIFGEPENGDLCDDAAM